MGGGGGGGGGAKFPRRFCMGVPHSLGNLVWGAKFGGGGGGGGGG